LGYKSYIAGIFRFDIYNIVGVSATFEKQILLPQNGRHLIDGSHVISLQYMQQSKAQDICFLLLISEILAPLRFVGVGDRSGLRI
jgi:hypothetical protein